MSGGPAGSPVPPGPRERLLVATCCLAVATIIGLTAGAIAVIPDVARDLGGSQSELQWVADSFPLVVAALLLPAGALLDRFGRRRGMQVGLVILVVGLTWTGVTDTISGVVASRCVAGVGAALLFPGTLATITAVVPDERRRNAVAMWAVSLVIGAVLGLLLCAALAELLTWQAGFLVFAALAALLVVLVAVSVPETRSGGDEAFDGIGAVLSILGVGAVTFAVTEGPVHGWLGAACLGVGTVGVVLLAAFVAWELRHPTPLLDVRLFLDGRFGAASVALFVMFFAHFALFFLAFQYLGYVLGYSTLESAIGIVPPVVGFVLTPFSPRLAHRFGRRRVMVIGLLLAATGTFVAAAMAFAGGRDYWTFACGAAILWCGMGLAMAPPSEMIIEAAPADKQGVASAVNDLARELGASFGIAVAGSAFNAAYRAFVAGHTSGLPAGIADATTLSPAAGLAAGGDGTVIRDGIASGWSVAFLVLTGVLLVGTLVVQRRCPPGPT